MMSCKNLVASVWIFSVVKDMRANSRGGGVAFFTPFPQIHVSGTNDIEEQRPKTRRSVNAVSTTPHSLPMSTT
jgi:hypothetical protein